MWCEEPLLRYYKESLIVKGVQERKNYIVIYGLKNWDGLPEMIDWVSLPYLCRQLMTICQNLPQIWHWGFWLAEELLKKLLLFYFCWKNLENLLEEKLRVELRLKWLLELLNLSFLFCLLVEHHAPKTIAASTTLLTTNLCFSR